jgi:large subunit ribosomal protein L18
MSELENKKKRAGLRAKRVRAKVFGASDRPRLAVRISNLHIEAQVIDDEKRVTLAAATTVGQKMTGTKTEKAALVGADIAKKAVKAGVKQVVLDRGSRKYAGRLSALADAARKEGLEF